MSESVNKDGTQRGVFDGLYALVVELVKQKNK